MKNFLKSMYQFSKERADCLPASFSDNKLDLPVYKLKLNVFDIIAEIKKNFSGGRKTCFLRTRLLKTSK